MIHGNKTRRIPPPVSRSREGYACLCPGFIGMGRHPTNGPKLSRAEIDRAFVGAWGHLFPPILNLDQAAKLADVSPKTIYDWSHRGLLASCARRKGKQLRIFRDRFVHFLFDSKEQS